LQQEVKTMTHNVFHVDRPGVAKNIDSILSLPNLMGIQCARGCGCHKPIMQWRGLIRKIQQAGKSVVVDLERAELEDFISNVDKTGIMLWIVVDPNEQEEVLRRVTRWWSAVFKPT